VQPRPHPMPRGAGDSVARPTRIGGGGTGRLCTRRRRGDNVALSGAHGGGSAAPASSSGGGEAMAWPWLTRAKEEAVWP
jgi:hypothetical protein